VCENHFSRLLLYSSVFTHVTNTAEIRMLW